MQILITPGTFVFKNSPIIKVSKKLSGGMTNEVVKAVYLNNNESIDKNFFYGFRQLTEVAVKALSPGINDPGTAIESLRALSRLFIFRVKNYPNGIIRNDDDMVIIYKADMSFDEMFKISILPIWDYGKNDRMVQRELFHLLAHIRSIANTPTIKKLFHEVSAGVEQN